MRGIRKLAAVLCAMALLVATGGEARELRLSIETPPGHVRNMAAERWAEAIRQRTNGAVTVTVFPAAQLYRAPDAVRALASGALDLSIQASPTLSQLEPNLSVITLPMFFGASLEQVRAVLDGGVGQELWAMLARRGILVPPGGHFEFAPNHTAFTIHRAASYAELAGRTLATPPSPVVVQMLRAMGLNPVATPRHEIELQLAQGQIAGMGSVTDLTIAGGRLWEAGIRFAFNDNAGWGIYIPLVSSRSLERLPAEHRQTVLAAWGDVVGWAREHAARELAGARARNEAHGIVYIDPPAEMVAAMRQRMLAVQDQIVASSGMNAAFVARVAAALAAVR